MRPAHAFRRLPAVLLLACASCTAQAPTTQDSHLRASPPAESPLPSPVAVPLNAAALAALPREPVQATVHDRRLACEGVSLAALLQHSGAMPAEPLRGPHLTRYVVAAARDGYRALFSLAELDPTLGGTRAYVVDRCEGAALDDEDGPLRLLVPGAGRAARSVRQLDALTVVVAP